MGKLFKYDLRRGILEQWKIYAVFAVFVLIMCIRTASAAHGLSMMEGVQIVPTSGDFLFEMVKGIKPYQPVEENAFVFPLTYVGTCLTVVLLVGYYPMQDLRRQGIQVMIRTGSRLRWMISKIIWNLVAVFGIFVVEWAVCALFSLPNSLDWYPVAASLTQTIEESQRTLFMMTGMPLVVMAAAAQLQMALSLWMKPVFACVTVLAYLFISGYVMSDFLIGNYTMLLRSVSCMKGGVEPAQGLCICGGIFLFSIGLSLLGVRKKNIL